MADPQHSRVVVDLIGEVLQRRGRVGFTVTSSSMEPRLRVGDRAEVERLQPGGPRVGEMVLFRDPALGHVIHRVLWRWPWRGEPGAVYTKGDAVPFRDARLRPDQLLGRVVNVIRDGRVLVPDGRRRWIAWGGSAAGMVVHGALGRLGVRREARPAGAAAAAGAREPEGGARLSQVDAPRRRS